MTEASMLEIDFDRVEVAPSGVAFYEASGAPVKVPLFTAVRCLSAWTCLDCVGGKKQDNCVAWLADRDDPQSPTYWVTLCPDHLKTTTRHKPIGL